MVATTFSADTPNVVTQWVREEGVSGNWRWWAFLITGMLTVFVYAKLWRRSGVTTDLEFYEMRYSGRAATFLRGFRALYLGVFFNVVIMATVCVAAIKIGGILLGLEQWEVLLYGSIITVIYSALGGLRGVIITDFVQFIIAMVGAIGAAWYIVDQPQIGGLSELFSHPNVIEHMDMIPNPGNMEMFITLLILPLAVQWWSVWYPGAEPGGGGYIAQRMLAAKDEKNAIGATLLFNLAHYALRPWPWIIIALASLVVFPDLQSIQDAFPGIVGDKVADDLGYPAMLSFLPKGLLGLVIASLIAAFMSTISTHLNWGSSYVVNDFYVRFLDPKASEKKQVLVGRLSTVLIMILAALGAVIIENAGDGFNLMLQIGAGSGLIFILRWFWWRVSAWSELAGMVISFIVAIGLYLINKYTAVEWSASVQLVLGVLITTIGWIVVTFLTPATDMEKLREFCHHIKPFGGGWGKVKQAFPELAFSSGSSMASQILSLILGCTGIYSALFGMGKLLYGYTTIGSILIAVTLVCAVGIYRLWPRLQD